MRSIPAGAGETHHGIASRLDGRVDPRGCGGDAWVISPSAAARGRSPRVRGRRLKNGETGVMYRSIPAGAGETPARPYPRRHATVDPRGCGGDNRATRRSPTPSGRSPRVRGRHHALIMRRLAHGSIPAGAGETPRRGCNRASTGVDPRGCGGDTRFAPTIRVPVGRSPRVRGRPGPHRGDPPPLRSIPAGAGETCCAPLTSMTIRVDPRGCGGDSKRQYARKFASGRSPRVRGRRNQALIAQK